MLEQPFAFEVQIMTTYVEETSIRFWLIRKKICGFFLSLLRRSLFSLSLFFGGFLSSGLISALFLGGFFLSGCSCAEAVNAKPKPKNAINNVCRKSFIFSLPYRAAEKVNRLICCRLIIKRCLLFNHKTREKTRNILVFLFSAFRG